MSGPHHDPSNRALLEQIEQRTLDLQARIGSLERYVTALVNDRATQRKLVDHAIRLVAQKEARLAADVIRNSWIPPEKATEGRGSRLGALPLGPR